MKTTSKKIKNEEIIKKIVGGLAGLKYTKNIFMSTLRVGNTVNSGHGQKYYFSIQVNSN